MTRLDITQGCFCRCQLVLSGKVRQAPLLRPRHVLGVQSGAPLPQMLAHRRLVERAGEQTHAHLTGKIIDRIERPTSNIGRQVFDKPYPHPAFADQVNAIRFDLHRRGREVIHEVACANM